LLDELGEPWVIEELMDPTFMPLGFVFGSVSV
jgi:hypothetical protein